MSHRLVLRVLPQRLAIARLPPENAVPQWAATAGFSSLSRTSNELSVVCDENAVPADVKQERGWACLAVCGTLDFALVGVLAAIVAPLAQADISVFAVSTFDTDYVLLKEDRLGAALEALRAHGHVIER